MRTYVRDRAAPQNVRFRRAIERPSALATGDAAREIPNLSPQDALQLVHLYADRGSPKHEQCRDGLARIERYLSEGSPRLKHVAEIASGLPSVNP
jgi:hypothetical protein